MRFRGGEQESHSKQGEDSFRSEIPAHLPPQNEIIWNRDAYWPEARRKENLRYVQICRRKEPTSISKPLPESPTSFDMPDL